MPRDSARVAETREWLQKAALDLRGARIDLDARPPLLEDALFHCQQASRSEVSSNLLVRIKRGKVSPCLLEPGVDPQRGFEIPPGFLRLL